MVYTQTSQSSGIELAPDTPAIGSIIWLHGLGADGHDFVSLVPQLNLPVHLPLRFIFPHAPLKSVTINNGYVMRAWFDIYSRQIDQHIDQAGITDSVKLVNELIRIEEERGISTEKIILGGFSQGAVIALTAGLGYLKKLGGVIALSGCLPNADQVLMNTSQANQTLSIFLAHGTDDTIVPFTLGQTTANVLEKHGFPVTWKSYNMPHSVCATEISAISDWLKNVVLK